MSVITARMDYLPRDRDSAPPGMPRRAAGGGTAAPAAPAEASSRCTPGARLSQGIARPACKNSATALPRPWGPFGHRVFTDSAPVLEAELAARSGQGWRGKHTLVLNREAGSTFFGRDLRGHGPATTEPVTAHCGSCSACIDACPTQAIVRPPRDARRCISYLTIEYAGPIPLELRPDGQPHLWLRRLPAGVPLEQVRPGQPPAGF